MPVNFVWAVGDACGIECWFLEVDSMASVRHAIVHKELHHNVFARFAAVRDVLSGGPLPLSVAIHPVEGRAAVSTGVASSSFWALVVAVISDSKEYSVAPLHRRKFPLFLKRLDGFVNGVLAFLSAESRSCARLVDNIAVEPAKLCLELRHVVFRVGPQLVLCTVGLPVQVRNN